MHPSAVLDRGCEIGERTKIWHFSHVSSGATIGADCVLGQNVYVAPNVVIGDRVKIQNNVSVYEGVTIEDDVFLGPSCVFTNVVNPRAFIERKDEYRSTRVRRGASVGANATIVCGVEIGAYALVGAGATVTRDVPACTVIVGVPGRRAGRICVCGYTRTSRSALQNAALHRRDLAACPCCRNEPLAAADMLCCPLEGGPQSNDMINGLCHCGRASAFENGACLRCGRYW